MSKKNGQLFAVSGSCKNPEMVIYGTVTGTTFQSSKFSGTMNCQSFWDNLAEFAKTNNSYVELRYKR